MWDLLTQDFEWFRHEVMKNLLMQNGINTESIFVKKETGKHLQNSSRDK